jgi:hypothetical protein
MNSMSYFWNRDGDDAGGLHAWHPHQRVALLDICVVSRVPCVDACVVRPVTCGRNVFCRVAALKAWRASRNGLEGNDAAERFQGWVSRFYLGATVPASLGIGLCKCPTALCELLRTRPSKRCTIRHGRGSRMSAAGSRRRIVNRESAAARYSPGREMPGGVASASDARDERLIRSEPVSSPRDMAPGIGTFIERVGLRCRRRGETKSNTASTDAPVGRLPIATNQCAGVPSRPRPDRSGSGFYGQLIPTQGGVR